MLGLVTGVAFWRGLWAVCAIAVAPAFGLAVGTVSGLAFGFILALTYPVTWTVSLAFAQLARRWHTPLRLMRFLEDARDLAWLGDRDEVFDGDWPSQCGHGPPGPMRRQKVAQSS